VSALAAYDLVLRDEMQQSRVLGSYRTLAEARADMRRHEAALLAAGLVLLEQLTEEEDTVLLYRPDSTQDMTEVLYIAEIA
jgi:hypothetical protein